MARFLALSIVVFLVYGLISDSINLIIQVHDKIDSKGNYRSTALINLISSFRRNLYVSQLYVVQL